MISCILVVCEGNICRSPMAEGLLARRLPNVKVISAGCGALVGKPADPIAVELMSERSIDIKRHIAMSLSLDNVRKAQLILTMTLDQKATIERRYRFARGRVYRLAEHEGLDVIDPYRLDREAFKISLAQIERGTERWVEAITRLTS